MCLFSCAKGEKDGAKLLATLISGHFDNLNSLTKWYKNGIKVSQDIVSMYMLPINLPALSARYQMYWEQWINNVPVRQNIMAISGFGEAAIVLPYDFNEPDKYRPGLFNISILDDLKLEDLKARPDCKAVFMALEETFMMSDWTGCLPNETMPETGGGYPVSLTCNSLDFFVTDKNFPESASRIPYRLSKKETYDVPEIADNDKYKTICNY
ncbi:hypothetical protein BgiMline_020661 [Biomphalaria glabrata]